MTEDERVPIPQTSRNVWPGSRHVEAISASANVRLTAWLRPRSGGEMDPAAALALASTPPARRAYVDRATLLETTGAHPADVELFRDYCERFGLTVAGVHWRSVDVRGPLDAAIRAFGANVAIFETDSGQRFRHRSDGLSAPAEIAAILRGVFGLHQWPRSRKLGALGRHSTPLMARDVAARYQFPESDGAGQTIAVLQLRGIFNATDFVQCMQAQGLTPATPIVKCIDATTVAHEHATTNDLEAALDVQILAALVPAARIVVYEAPDDERGVLDAIREAVFDTEYAPSVLSISYGWPEHLWTPAAQSMLEELFTAATFVGVSVFCASGDNGAELDFDGKPHVLAPASSRFAIACGATVIADTGEQVWTKSGGGFSERFDVPAWQDVARPPAAQYGMNAGRGVPDVAAQQSPGYYVIMEGTELAMGGTSAVAPVWAALAARINHRLGVPIGFFLPQLYNRSGEPLFGEITTGSNGPFQAATGWDPCTGLGVPVGSALEAALRGA